MKHNLILVYYCELNLYPFFLDINDLLRNVSDVPPEQITQTDGDQIIPSSETEQIIAPTEESEQMIAQSSAEQMVVQTDSEQMVVQTDGEQIITQPDALSQLADTAQAISDHMSTENQEQTFTQQHFESGTQQLLDASSLIQENESVENQQAVENTDLVQQVRIILSF